MSRRFKRSRIIIIVPMSALVLLSSGCQVFSSRQYQPRIYTSAQECIQDAVYTREKCLQQFQKATQWHQTNAPQFNQKEECESLYGVDNCQSSYSSGRTTYYRPYMRGYIVGNTQANKPIYGSSSQGFRSVTGVNLGKQTRTTISPSKLGKSSPKGTVTRGRFGSGGTKGS